MLAIEEDVGMSIMHQCGSYAHCATCRVEFLEGELEDVTESKMILKMRDLLEKVRLSCQPDLPRIGHEGAGLMTVSSTGGQRRGREARGGDHPRT